MGCSGFSNFGIRRLMDANARFFNPGLPVYYRTQNFVSQNTDFGEMGFQVVPSASGTQTGTTDLAICPQPTVKQLTMRMLEAAIASGSALRMGARELVISHTWVASIQLANGYSRPEQVFTNSNVVGFVTDNLLLQVVSYTHSDVYGDILDWSLLCNANEIK